MPFNTIFDHLVVASLFWATLYSGGDDDRAAFLYVGKTGEGMRIKLIIKIARSLSNGFRSRNSPQ